MQMDFLKAEIERKKRQIQEKNVLQPEKKYFKRGDLAAVQEAEYLAKYGPQSEDIAELERKKKEALEEKGTRIEYDDGLYPLPREEVVRKLRERLAPILLFGETEDEANLRLRTLVIAEPDDARASQSRNTLMDALKNVDKQYLKAVEKDKMEGEEGGDRGGLELKLYNTNRTWGELQTLAEDLRRGNHKHDEMVCGEWIKLIMTMWGKELNTRDDMEKITVKGRMEAATFTQTKAYLKPLKKMLRKATITDDIRDSLSNMVRYMLRRQYIKANEKYMEMAIGNAPWPIGVTNAGIHARPGRERIFSKHVAHVLNDESQRKYIQGLKRLMTKCQQYFPTDPSHSVDFSRAVHQPDSVEEDDSGPVQRKVEFTSAKDQSEMLPEQPGLNTKDNSAGQQ